MRVSRNTNHLCVSFTQTEVDALSPLFTAPDGRFRAKAQISADRRTVILTGGKGNAFYKPAMERDTWRCSFPVKGCGADKLAIFGASEVITSTSRTADGPVVIADLPTAMCAPKQTKLVKTQPRRSSKRASATVSMDPAEIIVSGRASTTAGLSDADLLALKENLNAALSQGFKINFDEAGRVAYFERRVG